MRNQQAELIEKSRHGAQKNLDTAANELGRQQNDSTLKLKIGETLPKGVFHEDANSMSMATIARYSAVANGKPFDYLMSMAMSAVLIKGKLIFLYTFRIYEKESDLEQVKADSRKWIESVLAAN